MKLSVVIPLYNKARHIERAVNSVLAQSYSDFELIVVDDGSTDGGGERVKEFGDSRLVLISQSNAGECAARNRGIESASCDLIAFLDADDEWLPQFLETVVKLRERFPDAGIYATSYQYSQGDKSWAPHFLGVPDLPEGGLIEDYFRAALGRSPVIASAAMVPKLVFDELGGFPSGVIIGGDLDTWARIALRYRVAWSPTCGAIYHLSADNRVAGSRCMPDVACARSIEGFLDSGGQPISSRFYTNEYLAHLRLRLAKRNLLAGEKGWAADLLRKTRSTALHKKQQILLRLLRPFPSGLLRAASRARLALRRSGQ